MTDCHQEKLKTTPSCLLPVGLSDTIDRLHQVAFAPVPESLLPKQTKKQKRQQNQDKKSSKSEPALVTGDIRDAIDSALTKFDHLDAVFDGAGSRGMNDIRSRLVEEVCKDLTELHVSGRYCEGHDSNAQVSLCDLLTLGTKATSRHVGIAFGRWKKSQSIKR